MRYNQGSPNFSLPPLTPTVRNVLIGAVVLYAVELFVNNSAPGFVRSLAWLPFGYGFQIHQPFTRYLVQGGHPVSFLLSLIVLFFFLPMVLNHFKGRQLWIVIGSAVVGSLIFGIVTDGLGVLRPVNPLSPQASGAWGWTTLSTACVAVFGLIKPKAVVRLFAIIPIEAGVFAWGTGLIALLFFLYAPTLGTGQHLGTWLGLMAWWFGFGPGSTRRKLKAKGRKLERDLKRFTILEGGQQNGNKDDWVN